VKQALDYEIERQGGLVARGEAFTQETRGWDADQGVTRSQRSKEAAQDYRYFPEPDLPPLVIAQAEIEAARQSLPELPEARFERFTAQYGVSAYEAGLLLQSPAFADFFEAAARDGMGKAAANWMLGEVSRTLNERGVGIGELGLRAEALAELLGLVRDGAINLNTAKEAVFPAMLAGEGDPGGIVAARGLGQVSERGPIEAVVQAVLAANAAQLEQYRSGKSSLRGYFVGQVMKAGKGKMNPQLVNEVLDQALAAGARP
jgi:aspartyl-tRNA(Asn)/glutamyl-tRNA(Gln) amidotransferase subunit B